jgi:flagellar biosynthetic protein FlhB
MAEEPRDDSQERTEAATPKRKQEAQEKGQIARSRELNTAAVLIVSSTALLFLGADTAKGIADVMRECFGLVATRVPSVDLLGLLLEAFTKSVIAIAPFMMIVTVAAMLAPLTLGGWSFNPGSIAFRWEKLDPVKGMKRVFSLRGLLELVKALAKFALVTSVTVAVLWFYAQDILAIGYTTLQPALQHTAHIVSITFILLCAATLLIAAVDAPFQLWDHLRKLRMTRQEAKDELKHTEGKPEVKGRIRAMQRELAQRRMMEAVPNADVVIVNPTHYAVALTYDAAEMNAPHVVAKGADHLAMRIRGVAQSNQVPVVTCPALARSLFQHAALDQEIPAGLYIAVAHVLAYLFRLKETAGEALDAQLLDDLPIPEKLRGDGL